MSNLKDFAIMPSSDYQAICNAVRSKTGSTELLKSGELASAIEGISSGGSSDEKLVKGNNTILQVMNNIYVNGQIAVPLILGTANVEITEV